ncbi:MAG TPA: hypothetical protein VMT43_11255 [Acidimicrobiales bacterium]|nr:hypothetical protein [Acidimicrobiales bacterium]
MEAQLHLLSNETEDRLAVDWRLDESTRALGRRGVAEARRALRAALRHRDDLTGHDGHPHERPSAA